jgi:hypothetical protein
MELVPIDISMDFHASIIIIIIIPPPPPKVDWSIYKMYTTLEKTCSQIYEVLRIYFIFGQNLFSQSAKFDINNGNMKSKLPIPSSLT